jgi:hypothetical protein
MRDGFHALHGAPHRINIAEVAGEMLTLALGLGARVQGPQGIALIAQRLGEHSANDTLAACH